MIILIINFEIYVIINVHKNKTKENYDDLVQEFLKRYGKMNENQMLFEMFELVKQKKEQGTFDFSQIENACKSVAPFLNNEQRDYMYSLLEKLR